MKEENLRKKEPKPYPTEQHVINELNDVDFSGTYSYAQYLKWEFDERVELIKGKIFPMGAPTLNHQDVAGNIFGELRLFLKGKVCKVYIAPADVRFPTGSAADGDVYTVLQPDVFVVCDLTKLELKGCVGAPDLIVEVLSPSNHKMELKRKFEVYQEFGVKEYWIVDLKKRLFIKYILLENGLFGPPMHFYDGDQITSEVLPGFQMNTNEVFLDLLTHKS